MYLCIDSYVYIYIYTYSYGKLYVYIYIYIIEREFSPNISEWLIDDLDILTETYLGIVFLDQ